MTIERLHHEIKVRWNKLNSNHKRDLFPAELDDALRKAQDDYIEMFYSGNNTKQYKVGFEVTQQRIDMLSNLVKQSSLVPTLISDNYYSVNLPSDYRHFLSSSTSPCNSTVYITRHNDLNIKLSDSNTKPSKKWNRVLGVFRENKLFLHTDGQITSVLLIYLKQPQFPFIGGYDTLEFDNGNTSFPSATDPQQQCEINEQFHDVLVDMTVEYLARCFEDIAKLQTQQQLLINKI